MKRITFAEDNKNGLVLQISQERKGVHLHIKTKSVNTWVGTSEGGGVAMLINDAIRAPKLRDYHGPNGTVEICDCKLGGYCPLGKTPKRKICCTRNELEAAGVFLERKDK